MNGMIQGATSDLASNISPYPRVTPNRQIDQASVDNAIALGGVKETNNIILQFNDKTSNQEVWHVTLTKIIENANNVNISRINDNLTQYLKRALKSLPQAPPS
jgi:tRNA threonylcarbamoyladenosine modification (KEOPS) complex Cgi121 subunit